MLRTAKHGRFAHTAAVSNQVFRAARRSGIRASSQLVARPRMREHSAR